MPVGSGDLLGELAKLPKQYCDSFCAGWNLARSESPLEYVEEIQQKNSDTYRAWGQTENINNGMVDGWKARQSHSPNEKS